MKYIALICARGGSKGVPGKNIKLLDGVPLIGWSIRIAKQVKIISEVIVSTDSQEVADIARKYGAETPFIRPLDLSQDNSSEWLVWRHALEYFDSQQKKIDGLIVIPPTAPLRNSQDIINCIEEFEKGVVDIVITVSDAHHSPYFNMIVNSEEGYASLVIPPKNRIIRRQDSPEVFNMTTVAYVVKPKFVKDNNGIFDGKVRSVYIPPERSLDIDTMLDYEIAEYLISNSKGAV